MSACQHSTHHGNLPAAYEVTWQTRGGTTFTELRCRSCISPFADQVAAEGGRVTAALGLPEPPAPIAPTPVGLDALTTTEG